MAANPQFSAATAHVDQAAVQPLPNSRKIYVEGSRPDIRVPMREVTQSDTPASFGAEKNPPIFVYDCSGPYTDPDAKIDIRQGLPALRAGFMVLADRYIYTLMARDLVRGMDEPWLKNLYGIALVPDAVIYLDVSPEQLVQRVFAKNQALDYWESGMDLGLSRDMFDSFLKYQALMRDAFRRLQKTYGFAIVDGERPAAEVSDELKEKIEAVLAGR